MQPTEPSSQGRRSRFNFFLKFFLFCVSSLQSVCPQNSALLINIGDLFYGNSSLRGLTSCHALILSRKSNYMHGTFIHTHKVTPIQHIFLSTTHTMSHLRTYSPLRCNEGRNGMHVATITYIQVQHPSGGTGTSDFVPDAPALSTTKQKEIPRGGRSGKKLGFTHKKWRREECHVHLVQCHYVVLWWSCERCC